MAQSPMEHGKPVMGLLHRPYGETRMSAARRRPVAGFVFEIKNMKKFITLAVAAIFIPQLVFAAWWNPLSWFNNWTLSESAPIVNTKNQELESRVKELEARLEIANTIKPNPTEESQKKVVAETKVVTTIKPKTTSQQTAAPKVNAQQTTQKDVADVIAVIDKASLDLAMDSAEIAQLADKMSSGYQRLSPYIDAGGIQIWGTLILHVYSKIDALGLAINSYLDSLLEKRKQILASGYVDKEYWLNTEMPQMATRQKNIKATITYYANGYNDSLVVAQKGISSGNTNIPQTPQMQNPTLSQFEAAYNEYNRRLNEVKQQLIQEYTAAGGYWTESQLEYNAMQKLKEMGIKPPVSPYGGLNIPNYNSAQCFSNPSGGLTCTGTSGTGAGQQTTINPIPGGGYSVQGY